jgi:hypothetical protein
VMTSSDGLYLYVCYKIVLGYRVLFPAGDQRANDECCSIDYCVRSVEQTASCCRRVEVMTRTTTMREIDLTDTLIVPVEPSQDNLSVLHTVVHDKLASGCYRSAVSALHVALKKGYQQAEVAVPQVLSSKTAMLSVRNHLAGLWCLYAHFLCEIGLKDTVSMHWNYCALLTIMAASECPLVGNHGWIAVALVRLWVMCHGSANQTGMGHQISKHGLGTGRDLCWDGLDRAHIRGRCDRRVVLEKPTEGDYCRMASYNVHTPGSRIDDDSITIHELVTAFKAIAALPTLLPSLKAFPYLFYDKKCAAMLCSELNCLSEFKEGLGCGRSLVATTPPPYLTLPQRGIEAFPLFRGNMIYTDTTVSSGKPLDHRSASLGWVNIVVETHAANKLTYGSGYNVNEKCLQCISILPMEAAAGHSWCGSCDRNTCI